MPAPPRTRPPARPPPPPPPPAHAPPARRMRTRGRAEDVVRERAGDVLLKNTLLKADHFPGAARAGRGQRVSRC